MSIADIVLNEFTGNSGIFPTPVNQNFQRLKDGILTRYEDVRSDLDEISTVAGGAFPKSGGTLTGNLTITKSAPYIYLKNTAQTAGSLPSSTLHERVFFYDKNGVVLGQVGNSYGTSGQRVSYLTSAKGDGTGNAYLHVGFDASGNYYTYAPAPISNAHANTIATTGWVDTRITAVTNTPRNQTVLFSGTAGTGTITLSENFTNFEQLIIIGCDDDGTNYQMTTYSTYWLNYLMTNYSDVCLFGLYNDYWYVKGFGGGSTAKKFVNQMENAVVKRIIGINRK